MKCKACNGNGIIKLQMQWMAATGKCWKCGGSGMESKSKSDMQKALAWADANVWTMMHPGPDEGQGRQWMLMVNSSKMYFGPSFYQVILNAWFTERPND